MTFRKAAVLGALIAVMATTVPAAGTILEYSVNDMVRGSETIVRGRVVGQQSYWLTDPRIIVTDVSLVVDEVWKGWYEPGKQLLLTVPGGQVGEIGMRQEHAPVFSMEEDAVLFLWKMPDGDGSYSVFNDEQGKYTVHGDEVVGFKRQAIPLAEFRAAIDRAIDSGQR